jgi:hypothetical protein
MARQSATNRTQTWRIAPPLSLRKSAIVLWSGTSRPVRRVPEGATDAPVKAPGPTTGNPSAAGPSAGLVRANQADHNSRGEQAGQRDRAVWLNKCSAFERCEIGCSDRWLESVSFRPSKYSGRSCLRRGQEGRSARSDGKCQPTSESAVPCPLPYQRTKRLDRPPPALRRHW